MKSVGVSILNYQAAAETIHCVEGLLEDANSRRGEYEIHIAVADNGSVDNDVLALQHGLQGIANVRLFRNDDNLGFSAGHNRNLAWLMRRRAVDYLWLLNNDCRPEKGALSALLACAAKRPEVAIWGATLLEADGKTVQCAGGCFYRVWLSSYRQHGQGTRIDRLDELGTPDFDYIAGASLFMPRSTLESGLAAPRSRVRTASSGWLNEEFFLYFEELDLAARLQDGIKMAWCRPAVLRHTGGVGTESGPASRSYMREYHANLSALKFTDLYHPRYLWIALPARFGAKLAQHVLRGRFDLIRPLWDAYRDFFAWRREAPVGR